MNRTVYCTFDHRDLADLAMGKLRASVDSVSAISYVDEHRYHNHAYGGDAMLVNGLPEGGFLFSLSNQQHISAGPPRPVTVRITCEENVQQQVVSKLINLHGYRIVAT